MNLLEQDYCGNEEIEQDEVMTTRIKLPFSPLQSPSSSSSARSANFKLQKQDPWLPPSSDHTPTDQSQHPSPNSNSTLEFTDLSLGNQIPANEKEHLFHKVVTPSDVGKLNRLVIPKQHAERYFPLDSNSNEKGLILNFEDTNGKQWRFRYSYWNSSQSYVMTKGWSRFVKEKKLTAGDIVSFQRAAGESATHPLYIDYRRRPRAPDPTSFSQFGLQNQFHFPQSSVRWGRLYSLPPPFDQQYNYSGQPYHHRCDFLPQTTNFSVAVSQQYFLRPKTAGFGGLQGGRAPMVIESVPVVCGRSAGKRLRLFGVNMESSSGQDDQFQSSSSSSFPLSQRGNLRIATAEADSNKGKSSLAFDLDL